MSDKWDELQKLADEATPGPWKLWGMTVLADPVGESNLDDGLTVALTYDPHRGLRTFNGSFICAARTAVPDLLAEVRRLTEENQQLRERADEALRLFDDLVHMPEVRAAIGSTS